MIADLYTKPLQGKLFKFMQDILIGLAPMPTEERVEYRTVKANKEVSVEHWSTLLVTKHTQRNSATAAVVDKGEGKYSTYAEVVKGDRKSVV